MSEYWVSKKKYFCKYCDIYITDDAPSRNQHESGLRHKGNKERFVRGLYKESEKKKKDLEEERREMKRIEQAAGEAFARDVGSGHARAGSSASPGPSTSTARAPPPKPTNKWANYTTAESLGITDPEEEARKAEAERRRTQGVAGEWQFVVPAEVPQEYASSSTLSNDGSKKRDAESAPDDDRSWKLRRKTLSAGLGEIYDPGVIPIKLKSSKNEEETKTEPSSSSGTLSGSTGAGQQLTEEAKSKWSKIQWKRPGEASEEQSTANDEAGASDNKQDEGGMASTASLVRNEEAEVQSSYDQDDMTKSAPALEPQTVKKKEEVPVKLEDVLSAVPPAGNGGSLFKKRKVPAGATGRGRR